MKNPLQNYFITSFFLTCSILVAGQPPLQKIKGQVVDVVSNETLPGATIEIVGLEEALGTVSENDGSFVFNELPLGRHTLVCRFIGYESSVEIIELTAAREVFIEFKMHGSIGLPEVVITSPNGALNPLAYLSARSISPEETQYYPVAANDIGRSMLSLPGVQPSKDNENDIIIRGNSSAGLLWRLEGVDILNPNHFARRGGSGGGITMFSLSLMDKSDFFTSAFPAEYGNALSGVFDLHFRKGNNQKREHTFRAGMIGLDLASEGPFKKDGASYLFNYRYSTLGLLNKMGLYLVGERVDNNFQDLSFSLYFPSQNKKAGLKIWGVGGVSLEEKTIKDMEEWEVFADSASTKSGSDMGVIGATYHLQSGNSFINITLAGMAQNSFYEQNVHSQNEAHIRDREEEYLSGRLSLASSISKNLGTGSYLKAGVQVSQLLYDLQYDTITENGGYRQLIAGKGNTFLVQPYCHWQWSPQQKWTINLGLHAMYFGLTHSFLPEPRAGISYQINRSQSLSFGYGLHSQQVPLGSYFSVAQNEQPNLDLDLMKSHHFVLSHEWRLNDRYRLVTELYFQSLFDIPVGIETPQTYWLLNEIEGYATKPLVSQGTGKNYGLDVLFEKYFRKNLFFLFSASLFNSKGTPLNGKTYNTQYNSHFSSSFTIGKEWNLSPTSTLQVGGKTLYNAGLPATPILNRYSSDAQPLYDEARPFSERIPAYFRIDSRVAFRKNLKNISWLLALDMQNVTSRRNLRPFGWQFKTDEMEWERSTQATLIPLLNFQLDF